MEGRGPLQLLLGGAHRERAVHVEHLPARAASTTAWPTWADAHVVAGYRRLGVDEPWGHQAQAAEALWNGRHTVIATGTGSGKSLAAWLPALTAVTTFGRDGRATISSLARRPTTLYLSPTKALAADQLASLERLIEAAQIGVRASACDGDTPFEERDWVRNHADLVLTNPDFLHFSLLPGHRRWQRTLRALRFVVVDECHAYRGVLGAHVALVLRRLLRVARHYGANPTVLLASATTGSPALTASRMIGVPEDDITTVARDDSPAGRRTVVLWEPPLVRGQPEEGVAGPGPEAGSAPGPEAGSAPGPRRSSLAETADLLAELVAAGARTLAFTRARSAAEAVSERTRDHLADVDASLPHRVAAYRGGYLPEERRHLERSIRSGELLALATTNALELGIDLTGLDAVLIAGWPGSRASLWQQAGRSGRAGSDGLALLVAGEDPLDAYLVHHPEAIFGAPVEATAFDPENPYVLAPHVCAASAELPLRDGDLAVFGLRDDALLAELARRGLLRRRPDGWYWNHARPEDPTRLTDLRGSGGSPAVPIVERATGRVLGTVDAARADATVHAGAVYVHQGRTYLVEELTDGVALAHDETPLAYRTRARSTSQMAILEVRRTREWGDVRWGFGTVELTSRVAAFTRLRLPSMEPVGTFPLDLPERRLRTTAAWYTVGPATLEQAGITAADLPGALHAAEHAAIAMLPLLATCDRWDIGGLSTALHEQTLQPTVFVHDGYPGGAGFAERGFAAAPLWLATTRDAIAACPCEDGCPSCVQSPKCGNGNSPLDKAAARRLLTVILQHEPRAAAVG